MPFSLVLCINTTGYSQTVFRSLWAVNERLSWAWPADIKCQVKNIHFLSPTSNVNSQGLRGLANGNATDGRKWSRCRGKFKSSALWFKQVGWHGQQFIAHHCLPRSDTATSSAHFGFSRTEWNYPVHLPSLSNHAIETAVSLSHQRCSRHLDFACFNPDCPMGHLVEQ